MINATPKQMIALRRMREGLPLKFLVVVRENKRTKKLRSVGPFWYAGAVKIPAPQVQSMVNRRWVRPLGQDQYTISDTGLAVYQMLSGRQSFDFSAGAFYPST